MLTATERRGRPARWPASSQPARHHARRADAGDGRLGGAARAKADPELREHPRHHDHDGRRPQHRLRAGRHRLPHQAHRPRAAGRQRAAYRHGSRGRAGRGGRRRHARDDGRAPSPTTAGRCARRRTAAWPSSACRRRCPSSILLDLMMPEMDGFEFISDLREQRGLARHPRRRASRPRTSPPRTTCACRGTCGRCSGRRASAATSWSRRSARPSSPGRDPRSRGRASVRVRTSLAV